MDVCKGMRDRTDNVLNNDSDDDMDWGGMLEPVQKKVIVSHKTPYTVSRSVCHGIENNNDDNYSDIDEYTPPHDITHLSDHEIMSSASLVARNMKNNVVTRINADQKSALSWILESSEWLLNAMTNLADKLCQVADIDEELEAKDSASDSTQTFGSSQTQDNSECIGRNSYKFCEFGHNCSFNYCRHKNRSTDRDCYSQHYVYPLVKSDLQNLISHISTGNIMIKEVVTSINTITYVINHMYNELNELKKTDPETYEKYRERRIKLKCITKNSKRRHRK